MTEAAPKIEELLETRARERDVLLLATLVHVPFDGWTMRAVTAGVADAGYPADMALRAFPDGMEEMIAHFSRWADRRMVEELAHRNLAEMKIRERIKACVQVRLEILAPHREAVRKALAFLALPGHQALTTKLTYETVNAMWYEAGDRSTDYNFYTKRGLLAAVLGSTV
ncbi:MAG: COQ9 family protein, partial [Rhodospirillales bacterium]